jgi:tetratricopeptide (TPR) repeat protein
MFKRPGQADDAADEPPDLATIAEKKVKDFAHLGELLRAKGRHKAALAEYDKAVVAGGEANPYVQNGAASALRSLGRDAEVAARLARVRSYYPGHLATWLNLGGAALALGRGQPARQAEALAAYEEALGLNPFHPEVLNALAALYTALGDTARAQRARDALAIASGAAQHGAPP